MHSAMDLHKALGTDLDRLAEIWGLVRNPSESDEALAHRIRVSLDSDGVSINALTGDVVAHGQGSVTVKIYKKCECGAASLGHTQTGQAHSSWCPLRE